jgi:hypothetical protein
MRQILGYIFFLAWIAHVSAARAEGDALPWQLKFASVSQATTALSQRDRFIQALSPFDRQSRLGTSQAVTEGEFLEYVRQQVLPWTPGEMTHVREAVALARNRLREYSLPLPKTILLIKTSGKEEGGAAYCRQAAIILPQRMLAMQTPRMERLLIHELFHVLSNQNPQLRKSLYASIGFRPCNPISLPAALRDLQITNPDGPGVDTFITLESEGGQLHAAPVLFARKAYSESEGGAFFDYMQFRLMLIQFQDGRWIPLLDPSSRPQLLEPRTTPSYLERIGGNTGYIIHPDEILAENFVHLMLQTKNLKSPQVVEGVKRILQAH